MKNIPLRFPALPIVLLLCAALTSYAQTLPVTNNLTLWLKADAGVTTNALGGVMQWNDQTPNANNASQIVDIQAPLLVRNAVNSRPAVRFDGSDDFLDVADSESLSGTGDLTSYFVIKFDDFATYRAVWAKTVGNLPAPTDIYAVPGDGRLTVLRGDGTAANLSSTTSDQPLATNTYLAVGFDVAGGTLTHYLNNQVNGSGPVTTSIADGNTVLKIGTRSDVVTRMKGDIAELLIYDRALSATERSNVVNYLRTKYNLNIAPSVALTATPAGSNVVVGDVIRLTATANDSDGSIARVEFLANGGTIGTATVPPYSLLVKFDSPGTVQFTARAIDNAGAFSNSAPITVTATSGATTDLTVKDGLQLWLKADEGTVTGPGNEVQQWADQSGNGNNAMPIAETTAPLLVDNVVNGRPALLFDGTDDVLEVAHADSLTLTGDVTSFFVVRFTDFTVYRGIWAQTSGNLPTPNDLYAVQNNGRLSYFRGDGAMFGAVNSTQPFAAGAFLQASVDATGTTVHHYYNGSPNGVGSITVPVADAGGTLRIGSRADGVTRMKGEMAELLIFNRALSSTEHRSVEIYLAGKYGLPALISSSNAAPTVVLTTPALVQAPSLLNVTANATDPDGSIAAVQFFADNLSLGTDTSAPFSVPWNLSYGGVVTLRAVATDNLGTTSTSAPVQLCIQGPAAPAGLVGYWPLDGNASALIGVGGIMVSNPVPVFDRNGTADKALHFDGTQKQRVEIPGGGGLNGAAHGSIALWVKWSGLQDAGFGNTYGAVLGRQANGIFSDNIINIGNPDPDFGTVEWRQINPSFPATITSSAFVLNETWRHIVVTFTETNSELFVDGFSEGIGSGGVLRSDANIPLMIGAWGGDGDSYATASIDDVAVWNRVLASSEVQALAEQSKTPLNLLLSPDCLTIERSGPNASIRWGSATVLQATENLLGPWTDVANAASPYVTGLTNRATFYRLRSP